jgi:hypothetical protein
MEIKKGKFFVVIGIVLLIGIGIFFGVRYSNNENFSVNKVLIKLTIPQGSESIGNFKIINHEEEAQNLKISFNGLEEIASTEIIEFVLGAKESRDVEISFKDVNQNVEAYFGQIIVESSGLTKKIPTIIEVGESNPFYAISQNSIPRYDPVFPGSKLGVNIKIFNLMDSNSHNVQAIYSIQNSEGEIVFSEEENLIIKESLETSKVIDIPKSFAVGKYLFVTHIKGESDESVSGYFFEISEKKSAFFSSNLMFFTIIIIAFLVGILIMFFYLARSRDKLLLQLRKQQGTEVERNLKVVESCKKKLSEEKPTLLRKRKLKQVKIAKRTILKKVKAKHKKQKTEVKKFKKKGKKNVVKNKIKSWQKEGYKIPEAEKEMKKVLKGNVGNKIKGLKKQGYKINFLNK